MSQIVFLNGKFLPVTEAKVSVLDRGFLFGDGVYEVIPSYSGVIFHLEDHIERLQQSLDAIHLPFEWSVDEWRDLFNNLLEKNNCKDADYGIYLQITRGSAPRSHYFPDKVEPTIFAMANPFPKLPKGAIENGFAAITADDIRWSWCYIKSITLLPNSFMMQNAYEQGAREAILIRDGYAIECGSSNLFIVKNGVLKTPPKSVHMLGGITREVIIMLAERNNWTLEVKEISEAELFTADEIWATSSTKELYPIVKLNNKAVGDGIPGQYAKRMLKLYREYKKEYIKGAK